MRCEWPILAMAIENKPVCCLHFEGPLYNAMVYTGRFSVIVAEVCRPHRIPIRRRVLLHTGRTQHRTFITFTKQA
eukprot:COSAG04_NODE_274_length_18488_cov_35.031377_17_plen_75_part_00